jgi:hypothetical protein
MLDIIKERYSRELNSLQGIPIDEIHSDVSSIYFINNMLVNFTDLQFFKIKISEKRNYTRLIEKKEGFMLNYAYRIVYAKLDLTSALGEDDLFKVKELLTASGILSKSKINKTPYLNVNVNFMFNIFGERETEQNFFSEYFNETITTILEVITEKLESDNTNILLMLEK